MKLRSRTQDHDLKLTGGKFKTHPRNLEMLGTKIDLYKKS